MPGPIARLPPSPALGGGVAADHRRPFDPRFAEIAQCPKIAMS
jgi:hypothetical protein